MNDNSIITEVDDVREALARTLRFDIEAIMRDTMQRERFGGHEIVSFPPRVPMEPVCDKRKELVASGK